MKTQTQKIDGRQAFVMPENPPVMEHNDYQSFIQSYLTGRGKLEWNQDTVDLLVNLPASVSMSLAYAYMLKNPEYKEFFSLGALNKEHYEKLYKNDTSTLPEPETEELSSAQYATRVDALHMLEWAAYVRFMERHPAAIFSDDTKKAVLTWTQVETETHQAMIESETALRATFGALLDYGIPTQINNMDADIVVYRLSNISDDEFLDVRALVKEIGQNVKATQALEDGPWTFTFRLNETAPAPAKAKAKK